MNTTIQYNIAKHSKDKNDAKKSFACWIAALLMLFGLGMTANAANGDILFSENFDNMDGVPYTENTARSLTTGIGGFDFIGCNNKTKHGIAINHATGAPAEVKNAEGVFVAYTNNTSSYWSVVRSTDFAASAPTALKITMKVYFDDVSSGTNCGVSFAIGDGFSPSGYVGSSAPTNGLVNSGFSIKANGTATLYKYQTTTNITSTTGIGNNKWNNFTWVINNTGEVLTYMDPTGNTSTLSTGKFDIWVGTVKLAVAGDVTTSTVAMQEIYIGSNTGKKHFLGLDEIVVTDLSPSSCSATLPANVITSNAPRCASAGVTLTATGAPTSGDRTWYWQNSATGVDKTSNASTAKTVTTAGISYLRAYSTNEDCWSAAQSYEVVASDFISEPTANAGADKSGEVNSATTLAATAPATGTTGKWTIKAGSVGTGTFADDTKYNTTFTPDAIGSYTLVWTVTNDCEQSASDEITFTATAACTVADPTGTISVASSTCGGNVTLTQNGTAATGDVWYWQTSATGTSTSNPVSDNYTVDASTSLPTVYVRSYNTAALCWSSGTISYTVLDSERKITPTISGSSSVAIGGNITFEANVAGTWTSSNDEIATIDATSGEITAGLSTGTATITFTSTDGCTNTKTITVQDATACNCSELYPIYFAGTWGDCGTGVAKPTAVANGIDPNGVIAIAGYTSGATSTAMATGVTFTTPRPIKNIYMRGKFEQEVNGDDWAYAFGEDNYTGREGNGNSDTNITFGTVSGAIAEVPEGTTVFKVKAFAKDLAYIRNIIFELCESAPAAPSALTLATTTPGKIDYTITGEQNSSFTYEVQYKKSDATSWTTATTTLAASAATVSGSITGLDYTTSYDVRVRTIGYKCESAYVTSTATTIDGPPAVPAPDSSNPSATGFEISWEAVAGAVGYEIQWSTDGTTWSTAANSTIISYSPSGLNANTTYYYQVRSYKESGADKLYSDWSESKTQITLPAAPQCANPSTTGVVAGFNANWTAPAVVGTETYSYILQLKSAGANVGTAIELPSSVTSYNFDFDEITPGTSYTYTISAKNAEGTSTAASCAEITAPTAVTITWTIQGSGEIICGNDIITASGTSKVNQGAQISIKAVGKNKNGFARWFVGNEISSDNPLAITADADKAITAVFQAGDCTTHTFTVKGDNNYLPVGWTKSGSNMSYQSSFSAYDIGYGGTTLTIPASDKKVIYFSVEARIRGDYQSGNTDHKTLLEVYMGDDKIAEHLFERSVAEDAAFKVFVAEDISNETGVNIQIKTTKKGGASSSSAGILIKTVEICYLDVAPPTITFDPLADPMETDIAIEATTLKIISDKALYQMVNGTWTAIANNDALKSLITLKSMSGSVTNVPFSITAISTDGKEITVEADVTDGKFAYDTQYQMSISNVGDAAGNIVELATTAFITRKQPLPLIKVEDVDSKKSYASGATVNIGTSFSTASQTQIFKVTNIGNDLLDITGAAYSLTGSTQFSGSTKFYSDEACTTELTTVSLSTTDAAYFKITFNPGTVTASYQTSLSLVCDDHQLRGENETGTYILNMTGSKANMVLPYTYESNCKTPIISDTEIRHDYSSTTDMPTEITLEGKATLEPSYPVFASEGNCVPKGSSALRVGGEVYENAQSTDPMRNNRLKITLTGGVGEVSIKWCANGYRKAKIYTDDATFLTTGFLQGGNCYSHSAVLNIEGNVTIYIEFPGTDATKDVFASLYYLNITPYNIELKSDSRNIVEFETDVAGEKVRIYDDVIFVSYPSDYTGNLSSITPDKIKLSHPEASVAPAQGATATCAAGTSVADGSCYFLYTVTAQDGKSTKEYKVFVDKGIAKDDTKVYADSVFNEVLMNQEDQRIEVLEISNGDCTVPISGTGSGYTIYYLEKEEIQEKLTVDGPTAVCIGTTNKYTVNAPPSNKAIYKWEIDQTGLSDENKFTIVDEITTKGTLELKAPNRITEEEVSIIITVTVSDQKCSEYIGRDTIKVKATTEPPTAITGITYDDCISNGQLELTAEGSNGATKYDWFFYPTEIADNIQDQNGNWVLLNVGDYSDEIKVMVNVQNGCGITEDPTEHTLNFGTAKTIWTGAKSSDWFTDANWTARVPKACTDVVIPPLTQMTNYPSIVETIEKQAVCNDITFEPTAGVHGIHELTYERAFVKVELERNNWYTLTAPLQDMYSGDFYFEGTPIAEIKLFGVGGSTGLTEYPAGEFTKSFSSLAEPLSSQTGFALYLSQTGWNRVGTTRTKGSTTGTKTLTFPRMTKDSVLITSYTPYNSLTGKLMTAKTVTVGSRANAYRLASDVNSGAFSTSLNAEEHTLIANPSMSHLDFAELVKDNACIGGVARFWNGGENNNYLDLKVEPDGSCTHAAALGFVGGIIPPMQSFVVSSANAATLNITPAHFTSKACKNTSNKLRSTASQQSENTLYITVQDGEATSTALIVKRDYARNNFEKEDVTKLFSNISKGAEVYTMVEDQALSMNYFNQVPFITPLGLSATNQSNRVTLSFEGAETFDNVEVILINNATGEEINLREETSYELDMTKSEGKLFVEFRSTNMTSSDKMETSNSSDVQIFVKDNNLIRTISSPNNLIKEIIVMDEVGRLVKKEQNINAAQHDLVMNNLTRIYIVRAVTEKGVKTAKILVQ